MTLKGSITRYDEADALGDIRLEDGREIRFGLFDCNGFRALRPTAGVAVLVGGLRDGFGGRLRATSVTPTQEVWDREILVHGRAGAEVVDDGFEKRVRLVPLDLIEFHARNPSWVDLEELAGYQFGRRVRGEAAGPLHPLLEPWLPQILETAVRVGATHRANGIPGRGASFVGGGCADIGDAPWPKHSNGRAMAHLAQISAAHAAEVTGRSEQINVFLTSTSRDSARPHVMTVRAGSARVSAAKPWCGAVALEDPRWIPAFPSALVLARLERGPRAILDTYRDAPDLPPLCAWSAQSLYETAFPRVDRVAPVVLGGFGETLIPGNKGSSRAPYRRLLTLNLDHLPEFKKLRRPGYGSMLCVDYEPTSAMSWMY